MPKHEPINVNISRVYHLTRPENLALILRHGLKPSMVSGDGVAYGEPRIYFLIDTDIDDVDLYLKNRLCLAIDKPEVTLYRDKEYDDIFGAEDNPMAFIVTQTSIPPSKIHQTELKIGVY